MSSSIVPFPLSGVIGIIDSSAQQLAMALDAQLRCVEVRADLLSTAGLSEQAVLDLIRSVKESGIACLFTLRHKDQGGTFSDDESARVLRCQRALDAGADIIDLEYGTEASSIMLSKSAPVLLSYHNFEAMISATELADLTQSMEQSNPLAIKVIPTGQSTDDALMMLDWVANAKPDIKRIGFTMGSAGGMSRILTLAYGAPVTYASFGAPVAPGQIDMSSLLTRYNCNGMNSNTLIHAVVGTEETVEKHALKQLSSSEFKTSNCVWIGFNPSDRQLVAQLQSAGRVNSVTVLG